MKGERGLFTGGITVGEDELTLLTHKSGGVPDGLVEEGDETAVVAWRTVAGHDLIRESDVVFVVVRVQLSVPARRKHQLEADALGTVCIKIGLVGKEMTV